MVKSGAAICGWLRLLLCASGSSLACAHDAQLQVTSVNYANMYVISEVDLDNEQECLQSNSLDPDLQEIFMGIDAGAICEMPSNAGYAWTDCLLKATYLTASQDTLQLMCGGAGEAMVMTEGHAFSRQIVHTILTITSTEDTTVGINWSLQASGLGTAFVRLRNSASQTLIQEELNSYIFPVSEEGVYNADLSAQETWTLTIYTDLQAMHQGQDEAKFEIGDARASVVMVAQTGQPGDINNDGLVNGADLSFVLQDWGWCGGCPGDVNEDGIVDGADLAIVLASWTF